MAVMCGHESWSLFPDKAIREHVMLRMAVDGQGMIAMLKHLVLLSFVVKHVRSFENWGTRHTLFHPNTQRFVRGDSYVTCGRMGIVRCRHFITSGTGAMRVAFNRGR
jgi:hypothetical protein